MARFNDTVKVTPTALRHFAGALKRLAEIQERQADSMETSGVKEVEAKNLKTALAALAALGKFAGSAVTSFCDQINEEGVADLEGAVLQYNRYLKRGKQQLATPDSDHSRFQPHATAEERQAVEEAGEKFGLGK